MLSREVEELPGGRTAFGLLALGLGTLFVCFMMVALASGDLAELEIGSSGWVVPGWALVAVVLAFRLRHHRSRFERRFSGLWLAIGVAAVLFFILGTQIVIS
tara:strand:+ start:17027 stop:17332 length:306 start_codon:yes stop_codon:yes gene_type:complete